jgi:hypothetical protein
MDCDFVAQAMASRSGRAPPRLFTAHATRRDFIAEAAAQQCAGLNLHAHVIGCSFVSFAGSQKLAVSVVLRENKCGIDSSESYTNRIQLNNVV